VRAAGGPAGGLPAAPARPRTFRGLRATQIAARTVHIASMGLVLGGVAFHVPASATATPIAIAIASGTLLMAIDLWKSGAYFTQGNGVAVLLKLVLLGVGQWIIPGARLGCFLVATAVASVGSHMPKTWRHWSLIERRVLDA
jgi:hypothetical protein